MIRNKVIVLKLNLILKSFFIIAAFFDNFAEYTVRNLFVYTESLFVDVNILVDIYHSVRYNFYLFAGLKSDECKHNTCILNFHSFLCIQLFACVCKEFTHRRHNRLRKNLSCKTVSHTQLFVVLISAYTGKVITTSVKEQSVQMSLCSLKCRRFAGTKLFVNLKESLFLVLSQVLFDSSFHSFVIAEEVTEFFV